MHKCCTEEEAEAMLFPKACQEECDDPLLIEEALMGRGNYNYQDTNLMDLMKTRLTSKWLFL